MTTACGINLSAFGATRRPLLAVATDNGGDVRIVLSACPGFDTRAKLGEPADELFAPWRAALAAMPRPIAVDVALELTGLSAAPKYLWQLTHRPLDFAFYGDAPVTDRIGEFGVRFRAMLAQGEFAIGRDLLEAAPGATVDLMAFKGRHTDGSAHYGKGGWKADDKTVRADKLMVELLTELGVNPQPGAEKVTSDDFNAMVCALTALAHVLDKPLLRGADLAAEVAARCEKRANLPAGAIKAVVPASALVLTAPFWDSITLARA